MTETRVGLRPRRYAVERRRYRLRKGAPSAPGQASAPTPLSTTLPDSKLRHVQKAAVVSLATLAEHKDPYAGQHILRVSRLSDEMVRVLMHGGRYAAVLDDRFREDLRVASMLHDVGKVTIPDGILLKPGRLDPAERAEMERHSHNGRLILERAARLAAGDSFLAMGAEIAGSHHEKYDGSGYPEGMKGEEIPLSARIVAVADVFDALTHKRCYKDAWPDEAARSYIMERAGRDFDPDVVAALVEVLRLRREVTIIEWTPAMSVGVEDLDNDHRVLIELINQLAAADSRRDRITLEGVFDELVDYTVFHFEREEQLLRRAGFPDLDAHKRLHDTLTGQVESIRERAIGSDTGELGDEVLEFLSRWLRGHIMTEDLRYKPFVTRMLDKGGT